MAVLGLVLFVAGYIGAQAGVSILPFDQHHFVSRVGGLLLGVSGLIWATR